MDCKLAFLHEFTIKTVRSKKSVNQGRADMRFSRMVETVHQKISKNLIDFF